jgi:RHS repeat-associated protein
MAEKKDKKSQEESILSPLQLKITKQVLTDHLGGTNIVYGTSIEEEIDSFAFGGKNFDLGTENQSKKFTGHEYDGATDLTYMKARYYDGDIGRFFSQDPAQMDPRQFLKDPQQLNYYSYVRNNPLRLIDLLGEYASEFSSPWSKIQRQKYITYSHYESAAKVSTVGAAVQVSPFVVAGGILSVQAFGPVIAKSFTIDSVLSGIDKLVLKTYYDAQDGEIDESAASYVGSYAKGHAKGHIGSLLNLNPVGGDAFEYAFSTSKNYLGEDFDQNKFENKTSSFLFSAAIKSRFEDIPFLGTAVEILTNESKKKAQNDNSE